MYGGSNEVFGKNENFPLVLDIKLHLKIPVNYQLQISPPPNGGGNFSNGASFNVKFLSLISAASSKNTENLYIIDALA